MSDNRTREQKSNGPGGIMDDLRPPLTGVLRDIANERDIQDAKWGGPEHDDSHGAGNWFAFIYEHLQKAELACGENENYYGNLEVVEPAEYRRRMVEVAALCVAAIETHDRHFNKAPS